LGGRRIRISEFEASLVYKVSSRTARAIPRNPVKKRREEKRREEKRREEKRREEKRREEKRREEERKRKKERKKESRCSQSSIGWSTESQMKELQKVPKEMKRSAAL
jgi:hypothetical protein